MLYGCFGPMTALTILQYPDPRLHTVAKPVKTVDDRVRRLVADMAETMYAAPGIGLAATQVDVHERVIVLDVSEHHDQLEVYINPEIVTSSEEQTVHEEGCLSVPGIYEEVERPDRVRVRALGLDGQPFTVDAEGLRAVCLQHEMDHLNGRVFVQYLSRLKQSRIRTKLSKRDAAAA
jgi:peptide deformylase